MVKMKYLIFLMYIIFIPQVLFAQSYECFSDSSKYVDLGLPSGTLWSSCNYGANKPTETGSYIAWGELAEKQTYSWDNYKYTIGSYMDEDMDVYVMSKYVTDSASHHFDNLKTLDKEDDLAFILSPGRIPSIDDFMELMENCNYRWGMHDNVKGLLVIGRNGNSIFFPAAGFYADKTCNSFGDIGFYWTNQVRSSIMSMSSNSFAFAEKRSAHIEKCPRYWGNTIRTVIYKKVSL